MTPFQKKKNHDVPTGNYCAGFYSVVGVPGVSRVPFDCPLFFMGCNNSSLVDNLK